MDQHTFNECVTFVSKHDMNRERVPTARYVEARGKLVEGALMALENGTPEKQVLTEARKHAAKRIGFNLAVLVLMIRVAAVIVQLVILFWREREKHTT